MRDYEDPVHVPPLALKIFTAGLVAAFIIAPLVLTLRAGYIGNLPYTLASGFAALGYILGAMFIHRLVLWFVFAFYWYLAAFGGFLLFVVALALIAGLVDLPQAPLVLSPSTPLNIAVVAGVILGVFALYLIFRPGGIQGRQLQPAEPPTPPPAQPPNPQKRILNTAQQIASRRKDLGLDDLSDN